MMRLVQHVFAVVAHAWAATATPSADRKKYLLATALAIALPMVAAAATPIVVLQIGRAFAVREIHVRRGDVVRFQNADEFIHQIYVKSPTFDFSSDEQSPGQNVDVTFPVAGQFDVRCQIHPKMLLHVTVE